MSHSSPLEAIEQAHRAVFEEIAGWKMPAHFGDEAAEYESARKTAALFDLSHRTKIELGGGDRVEFLQNLCTNDVKTLATGTGCEAFLTTAQGKIVGHVFVFAAPESLVLDTVPGQAEKLLEHLDRYLIREDVTLADRSADWAELLLCGPSAAEVLEHIGSSVPTERLGHADSTIGGTACFVRRHDLAGAPSYAIVAAGDAAEPIWSALKEAGAVPAGSRAFEVVRVETGIPLYGFDITDANLPQEVGRNDLTISFTKGCYIGQETIARIDSYGHVNRTLVGLKFSSEAVPERGAKVCRDEKEVGQVTSAVFSPHFQSAIALAYVRRGSEAVGTELEVDSAGSLQKAKVEALPFRPTT